MKLNENAVTRDQLEDAIEAYMDHSDKFDIPFSAADMTAFIAEQLDMDVDLVDSEFSKIISAAVNFDEDGYIDAVDNKFREKEIKEGFLNFYKKKCAAKLNERIDPLTAEELEADHDLTIYRQSHAYRTTTVEGKYRMLWHYVVREYGHKYNKNDNWEDLCMEIAMADDQKF